MPAEETAEERIGPYRLASRLGEGGMGVVYRAVDASGHDVAVKGRGGWPRDWARAG